jgi:hypothetical protein
MSYQTLPELTEEEKTMPLARFYYDYPMRDLSEETKAIIFGPPINYSTVVDAQNFTDWLLPCGEYFEHENGYCMFPDGSGYIATYMKFPEGINPKKIFWYLNWMNFHPKSQPEGTGNLRYKIWNPADHFDHYFINWKDKTEGIHTTESLDLGEGDRKYDCIRHPYNLRDYGLTQEKIDEIEASGVTVSEIADWESFDFEGAHLTLGQIRPCPDGGYERRSAEWIGWRPEKGKIVRVEKTPCSEAYLRKVAYHTLI